MKVSDIKFDVFGGVTSSHNVKTKLTMEELKNLFIKPSISTSVASYRKTTDGKYKKQIPAFCPMGRCKDDTGIRALEHYEPSEFTMIDLDKVENLEGLVKDIKEDINAYKLLGTILIYITCSGKGLRFVFRDFNGLTKMESAMAFLRKMELPLTKWDAACRDITRLSIISDKDSIVYWAENDDEIAQFTINDEHLIVSEDDIEDYVKQEKREEGNYNRTIVSGFKDYDGNYYKNYSDKQIQDNDESYKDFQFNGRRLADIVQSYIRFKSEGQGAVDGQKHTLYNELCKLVRTLTDNNPRILHAVLPILNLPLRESWDQCCHYCARGVNDTMIDKYFYYWLKSNGYMEHPSAMIAETVEDVKEAMYKEFVDKCPTLPPIIAEYYRIAPYYFKIPVLFSCEAILGLYTTNYRARYFDGLPISTTFYNLIYGPAGCGKSYMKRLEKLTKPFILRDDLSNMKINWYNELVQRNKQTDLPEKPKVKTILIPSRASAGEMCLAQKNMGNHHFLQQVAEFSVWSNNVAKSSTDLSGFYRIGYDNDRYGQQFMSANSFRGTVNLYPIILATCTEGQIDKFFKDTEDGLVTRFDYVPILNQEFAGFQKWKELSLKELVKIEDTQKRLLATVFKDPTDPDVKELESKGLKEKSSWDYEYLEPQEYDLSWLYEPLNKWLEEKLKEAKEDGNTAASMLRKRSARKAFAFAMLCWALWGKDDNRTKDKVIACMLWMAEMSFFFIRVKWEEKILAEDVRPAKKSKKHVSLFESMNDEFSLSDLEAQMRMDGKKTGANKMISIWRTSKFIKEIDSTHFVKVK